VAVIVGTYVFVLPQFADHGQVWAQVRMLSWAWIGILLAASALNVFTFAPPWMAALPGLRFLPALTVTQASTAGTYLAPVTPPWASGFRRPLLQGHGENGERDSCIETAHVRLEDLARRGQRETVAEHDGPDCGGDQQWVSWIRPNHLVDDWPPLDGSRLC
jgi:hypothetical protein